VPIAKINNININYKVTGQGEPLVMIMGIATEQSGWNSQVSFFKKYYRVITFDNRGCGKSDKPRGPYTMKMLGEDTIGLMDYLSIPQAHIMGISMGGMIAQEIAINYPGRVKKLILANTYAGQDQQSNGPTPEMVEAAESSSRKVGRVLVNLAYNKFVFRSLAILHTRVRSKFTNDSDRAAGKAGFVGQLTACFHHNTLEKLSLIKAPTLVVTGTQDRVIMPTSSETISRLISRSKLVKIEKGSHVINLEYKTLFNREVFAFLKDPLTP
jgi:3-oxoadipate enol-lactonase